MKTDLIVILGCTATGKTNLATQFAYKNDGEILSADSRQVYRGMDVGTGKDLSEFVIDETEIPYHLIDIKDAGEEYNLFEFQKDFLEAYESIQKRNKRPILCGGTGMYLEAVLKGYRLIEVPNNKKLRSDLNKKSVNDLVEILSQHKKLHNTTDTIDRDRIIRAIEVVIFEKDNEALINDFPKINSTIYGVHYEREIIKERITQRLKHRLKHEGMIEEVESLLNNGVSADRLKFYGLEYKLITQFLIGEIDRTEMFNKLNISIHQFAKRQATWFRKMERNGFDIKWIDGNLPMEEKLAIIHNNS